MLQIVPETRLILPTCRLFDKGKCLKEKKKALGSWSAWKLYARASDFENRTCSLRNDVQVRLQCSCYVQSAEDTLLLRRRPINTEPRKAADTHHVRAPVRFPSSLSLRVRPASRTFGRPRLGCRITSINTCVSRSHRPRRAIVFWTARIRRGGDSPRCPRHAFPGVSCRTVACDRGGGTAGRRRHSGAYSSGGCRNDLNSWYTR